MSHDDGAELSVHRGFRVGEWLVRPSLNRLTRGEEVVQLEPRLMDLLAFLARHAGRVVSQQEIIDAVWAQEFVGEGVLRRAIASIRNSLGDDAKHPIFIETIPKRGYRLMLEPVPAWQDAEEVEDTDAAREAAAHGAVRIGDTLSHYRIIEKIGEGGMGVVYRARDTALDRDVAVKVLAERVAGSPDRIARFEREAKAIAKLSHSNILGIFHFGSQDGVTYAVTELLEGESLRQALNRDGSLPVERALGIARAAAAGLAAAHSKRIIHRDIKPGNIFLTADGGVKILDFGLARSEPESMIETTAPDEAGPGLTTPGVILGTMGYMSPEQARGQPATPASDVFSLGCALYEMLTGIAPFKRHTQTDTLSAVLKEDPPPLDIAEQQIPRELQRVLWKALEKDPGKRYPSGVELEQALAEVQAELAPAPPALRSLVKVFKKPRVLIPTLIVLAIAGVLVGRWVHHQSAMRSVHTTAIPEIKRLLDEGDPFAAFEIAERARAQAGPEAVPDDLLDQICGRNSIVTEPPGATITFKRYSDVDGAWRELGQTPLEDVRLPLAWLRLRIDREGYETREVVRHPYLSERADLAIERGALARDDSSFQFIFTLDEKGSLPEGMVRVDGGTYSEMPLSGFPRFQPVHLDRFLIDRTEVTNRRFKEFMDAGGYQRPEFWKQEFIKDGRKLTFAEAMGFLRDATDRSGPARWELGEYEEGKGDYPVGGVSWYEAAAFCEFHGKSLPTVYHWSRAALPAWIPLSGSASPTLLIIDLSNFGGGGPARVGSFPGIAVSGALDMAGNAREWCFNATGDNRYSLGGSWADVTYKFINAYDLPPWDRSIYNGFRCVQCEEEGPLASLLEPVNLPPIPDFYGVPAVSNEVFENTRRLVYEYERTPINAVVTYEGESPVSGREQRVETDAAYNEERLPIRLHLPRDVQPPYQAVVWFPGLDIIYSRSMTDADAMWAEALSFFVKSGRVLVQPVYSHCYERNDGRTLSRWQSPNLRREMFLQWYKDLGRTLDYLEEREDIDADRIAFAGMSLGAGSIARNILSFENRFKAALLWSGGFNTATPTAGVTGAVQSTGRITIPVLMINGRYDSRLPVETYQKPFFDLLGTPPEHKRHVVFDTGHWPFPRAEFIKENLAWLDTYLGPVERAAQ